MNNHHTHAIRETTRGTMQGSGAGIEGGAESGEPKQLLLLEIGMTAVLLGMTGLLAWLWSL